MRARLDLEIDMNDEEKMLMVSERLGAIMYALLGRWSRVDSKVEVEPDSLAGQAGVLQSGARYD